MQKRTVTIRFELTKYQANQLKALGRTLWPAINLPCDELCRRVLLDPAHLLYEIRFLMSSVGQICSLILCCLGS